MSLIGFVCSRKVKIILKLSLEWCVNILFFVLLKKGFEPIITFFNYLLLSVSISQWWQGIFMFGKNVSNLSIWPTCLQFYTIKHFQITKVRNSQSNKMLVDHQMINFKLWFEHGYLPPFFEVFTCCIKTKYFSSVVC